MTQLSVAQPSGRMFICETAEIKHATENVLVNGCAGRVRERAAVGGRGVVESGGSMGGIVPDPALRTRPWTRQS